MLRCLSKGQNTKLLWRKVLFTWNSKLFQVYCCNDNGFQLKWSTIQYWYGKVKSNCLQEYKKLGKFYFEK